MGQRLDGIVGVTAAIDAFAAITDARLRSPLANGFEFLPFTPGLADSLGLDVSESAAAVSEVGLGLSIGLAEAIRKATQQGCALGYIDSDFAGGHGLQSGAVWRDGRLTFRHNRGRLLVNNGLEDCREWPVNQVLRALIEPEGPARDFFRELGLDQIEDAGDSWARDPDPRDPFYC